MSKPIIVPVIMSGGAGTRLWPLSRKNKPKQMHAIFDRHTLLQETAMRVPVDTGFTAPIVVCAQAHAEAVSEQLTSVGIPPAMVICEPIPRNTAPCAMIAALAVAEKFGPDALILLLAADHLISDPVKFRSVVKQGTKAAVQGSIVTFGPKPTRPETGYGYLRAGNIITEDVYALDEFVEKPDLDTAKSYLKDGRFLWNAGMFLYRADTMILETKTHRPQIAHCMKGAWEQAIVHSGHTILAQESFAASPSESVDNAIMENTDLGAVIALDAGWSDVGSWAAIHELSQHDEQGNAIQGPVVSLDNQDCLLRSDGIQISAAGLEGLAIIATANSVLILPLEQSQRVKDIVAQLPEGEL